MGIGVRAVRVRVEEDVILGCDWLEAVFCAPLVHVLPPPHEEVTGVARDFSWFACLGFADVDRGLIHLERLACLGQVRGLIDLRPFPISTADL